MIPVFKDIELIRRSSRCDPFEKWHFFCYKRAVAAVLYFKFTVFSHNSSSCSKEISQLSNMIPPWFQACINSKIACYLPTSIAVIRFFYLSLFHGSTWSDQLCQGHCVNFITLITTIHYSQRSVVDSRNFEGYCVCLRKPIVALLL